MDQRGWVVRARLRGERGAAAVARLGIALVSLFHQFGRKGTAGDAPVPRLAARLAASAGWLRALGALLGGIRRGWLRGVAGVPPETGLQLGQPGFQFLDPGLQRATAGTIWNGCVHTCMESQRTRSESCTVVTRFSAPVNAYKGIGACVRRYAKQESGA